jgi:hypothetical protein
MAASSAALGGLDATSSAALGGLDALGSMDAMDTSLTAALNEMEATPTDALLLPSFARSPTADLGNVGATVTVLAEGYREAEHKRSKDVLFSTAALDNSAESSSTLALLANAAATHNTNYLEQSISTPHPIQTVTAHNNYSNTRQIITRYQTPQEVLDQGLFEISHRCLLPASPNASLADSIDMQVSPMDMDMTALQEASPPSTPFQLPSFDLSPTTAPADMDAILTAGLGSMDAAPRTVASDVPDSPASDVFEGGHVLLSSTIVGVQSSATPCRASLPGASTSFYSPITNKLLSYEDSPVTCLIKGLGETECLSKKAMHAMETLMSREERSAFEIGVKTGVTIRHELFAAWSALAKNIEEKEKARRANVSDHCIVTGNSSAARKLVLKAPKAAAKPKKNQKTVAKTMPYNLVCDDALEILNERFEAKAANEKQKQHRLDLKAAKATAAELSKSSQKKKTVAAKEAKTKKDTAVGGKGKKKKQPVVQSEEEELDEKITEKKKMKTSPASNRKRIPSKRKMEEDYDQDEDEDDVEEDQDDEDDEWGS